MSGAGEWALWVEARDSGRCIEWVERVRCMVGYVDWSLVIIIHQGRVVDIDVVDFQVICLY